MNLLELISARRSIRQYLPDDIEQDKIDYLMECARLAPSAANFQPWKFLIVKDSDKKVLLQKSYPAKWFTSPPVYIVALANKELSWKRQYDEKDHYDIDLAIALEHIVLAATEKGLGSCWVCDFDADLCHEQFALPENLIPVAIITIGYNMKKGEKVTNRKTINEITEIL